MKSAVFYGRHDIRIEERERPSIGAEDILIRVKACGVCGTDVHIFEGDQGAAACTPPTILGHEFSGVIEAVGEKVKDFTPGERVCVDPNDMCGKCSYCRAGLGHFCESMRGIGTTVNGGFAEYCAVPAKQALRLAPQVSFEAGAMAEPVACCLHGIDLCEIRPGDTALIIGGGMIGLIMLQLARLAGAARTVLLEPVEAKRKMARRLGADLVIDPIHEDVKAVLARSGVGRIAAVIECAGLPATIRQAIDLAGKRSVVMMFGLTKPGDEVALRPFEIFQKEVVLKASFINPYTQQRAVDLINAGRIDVTSMVCAPIPLEALAGVLADPALRAQGKYIVRP